METWRELITAVIKEKYSLEHTHCTFGFTVPLDEKFKGFEISKFTYNEKGFTCNVHIDLEAMETLRSVVPSIMEEVSKCLFEDQDVPLMKKGFLEDGLWVLQIINDRSVLAE